MIIALIVYGFSWLVLLLVYLHSRFVKKPKFRNSEDPWYVNAILIGAAPIIVAILPFIAINNAIDDRKRKKRKAEEEQKKQSENERKVQALNNLVAAKNIDLHSEVESIGIRLKELADKEEFDDIMGCLPKLSLPDGYEFGFREAEENDFGDESVIFVTSPSGEIITDVFDVIQVEDSPMGAVQAYFLYKIWHYLPLWWHSNYAYREYVYTDECLANVSPFRAEDKDEIIDNIIDLDVDPFVRKIDGKYYVGCCYWSDFGGLIREFVEVTIKNNKVKEFYDVDEYALYAYNCGIRF